MEYAAPHRDGLRNGKECGMAGPRRAGTAVIKNGRDRRGVQVYRCPPRAYGFTALSQTLFRRLHQ